MRKQATQESSTGGVKIQQPSLIFLTSAARSASAETQRCHLQLQAQKDHIAEQNQRCRDLEASTRQLEERCSELKESAAGHELRAKEAAAEVLKGNRIIEKVSVSQAMVVHPI